MYKPESIPENEVHRILWTFKIQADHLIVARRPDLVIINKKKRTSSMVNFAVSGDHRVKIKENEKRDKHLDLAKN